MMDPSIKQLYIEYCHNQVERFEVSPYRYKNMIGISIMVKLYDSITRDYNTYYCFLEKPV